MITADNFVEQLRRAFPDRAAQIDSAVEFWIDVDGDLLLRSVLHAVVGNDLLGLVERGWDTPEAELEAVRILRFVDRMFQSEDEAVMDLADTGVLDDLAELARAPDLLPLLSAPTAEQLRRYLA